MGVMKKLLFLFFLVCFMGNQSFAQNIKVSEDFVISQMLQRHIQSNKSKSNVSGWRVQLLSTSDRIKVEEAKQKFMQDFPGVSVDWTHSKPYYRLRAGAFTSKLEAMRLLHRLKKDYPSAFPAKDNSISFREIVGI